MSLTSGPILLLGAYGSGAYELAEALRDAGVPVESSAEDAGDEILSETAKLEGLVSIHRRCFAAFGMSYGEAHELPSDWKDYPQAPSLIEEIRQFLVKQFGDKPRWGLADTALCFLYPIYAEALAAEGVTPERCVICVADPARSENDRISGLWLEYTLGALNATQHLPRSVLTAERLSDLDAVLASFALPGSGVPLATPEAGTCDLSHAPAVLHRTYELCNRLGAGFPEPISADDDAVVDALHDETFVLRKMVSAVDLPDGTMFLSWQGGWFSETYFPTGSWQSFRKTIEAPPGSAILFDPYQIPFQMWIRKAVWHVAGQEKKAVFRAGRFGVLEELHGIQRLKGFGPGPAVLQAPARGPFELELEFLIQSGPSVVRDAMTILNRMAPSAGRRTR